MVNNTGRVWAEEIITNRVTVSKNANYLRVSIKAPEFAWGNNFLTLCITIGVLAECAITYLMVKSGVSLAILIPGFLVLGAALGLSFVKLWLWHNFGEELINIRGNSFEMHRNYGLYKSDVTNLVLNDDSELYTNRNDTWSWSQFRGKGIFRLATIDAKLADFGLKLDDAEYALIVKPVSEKLKSLQEEEKETTPSSQTQTTTIEESQEGFVAPPEDVVAENEEIVQPPPPSLEEQTEGQHRNVLNDYLDKAKDGKKAKDTSKKKEDSKKST